MKNKIKALIFSTLALFMGACNDDLPDFSPTLPGDGTLPVEFEFNLPDDALTRANPPAYPKIQFDPGDVIHIMAVFQMETGNPRRSYGAYIFNENRQWEPLRSAGGDNDDDTGSSDGDDDTDTPDASDDTDTPETSSVPKIVWPDKSTSGSFRAYYIKSLKGAMIAGQETQPIMLSDLAGIGEEEEERATDPLSAGIQNVVYGHTVKLNFVHACTYLTVEELQAGISNTFWFMCDNDSHKATTGGTTATVPFNNAFKLTLSENNELELKFVQVPDDRYKIGSGENNGNDVVYVAGKTVNYRGEDGLQKSKVGFYLEPGIYNSFVLSYPMTEPDYNRYFSYTKSSSAAGTDDNKDNNFHMNNAYTFNVAKDSGVKMESSGDGGEWDEGDEIIYLIPVEVEEFLYAINKGQSYRTQEHDILEATNNGTKLLMNVDFNYYYYDQFGPDDNVEGTDNPRPLHPGEWFVPDNINEFDGNHKYIYRLGAPLFNENTGTIKNLGINDMKADNLILSRYYDRSDRGATKEINLSLRGTICCTNSKDITNVRVKNVTINALTDPEQNEEGEQEAYSFGSLVGYNQGNINDIYIYGQFNISIKNYPGNTIVPTVNMGGLVGQNISMGVISDVKPLEGAPSISIKNTCSGSKALYIIGGISGGNVGSIDEIYLPNVTVDSSGSKGKWAYIGGLAGVVSESSTGSMISNCIVQGSVIAGDSAPEAGFVVDGASYTGGEVGNFNITGSVSGCRTVVNVTGPTPNMVHNNVTYAVGGGFGRITAITSAGNRPGTLENLVITGTDLKGPTPIGTFAGIVPEGSSWDLNSMNVVVKSHNNNQGVAIPEIGQTM